MFGPGDGLSAVRYQSFSPTKADLLSIFVKILIMIIIILCYSRKLKISPIKWQPVCLDSGDGSIPGWLHTLGAVAIQHNNDVIMGVMASQITSLMIVYWTVLFRRRSKKTPKLRITGLCVGNSPVTGEFPTQMGSNAEMFPFDDVIMEIPPKLSLISNLAKSDLSITSFSLTQSFEGLHRALQYRCRDLFTISNGFGQLKNTLWANAFAGDWSLIQVSGGYSTLQHVPCRPGRLCPGTCHRHNSDIIMGAMASQITSLTIVYSTVYSGARKHQSSASLAFVCGKFTCDRWIPCTNGQCRGKCFHLMTTSWTTLDHTTDRYRVGYQWKRPVSTWPLRCGVHDIWGTLSRQQMQYLPLDVINRFNTMRPGEWHWYVTINWLIIDSFRNCGRNENSRIPCVKHRTASRLNRSPISDMKPFWSRKHRNYYVVTW